MKRGWLVIGIGIGLLTMLCVGMAIGIGISPARAQIARTLQRVLARVEQQFSPQTAEPGKDERLATPAPREDEKRVPGSDFEEDIIQDRVEGLLVTDILAGSPAEEAGVLRGDILQAVDDTPVNSMNDLSDLLVEREPGDPVTLRVLRGEQVLTLEATLSENFTDRTGKTPVLGILVCDECLNTPKAWQESTRGVLISEVTANSPAESAGLKAEERITAAEGEAIQFVGELHKAIAERKPGDELTLTVINASGETREVTVTLGENPAPEQEGRAWLGVTLAQAGLPDMDGDRLPLLPPHRLLTGFPQGYEAGALITQVIAGEAAETAGLQTGDFVLAINDQKLDSSQRLAEILADLNPGDSAVLTIFSPQNELSDTQPREVSVTLGENPDQSGAAYLGIRYTYFQMKIEQDHFDK